MPDKDLYASPIGVAYSAYMERRWLSRLVSRTVWGGDTAPYYEIMEAIREAPEGGTVVDCPCGAGPALRSVPSGRRLRYIAADLSPAMLRRAERRARARSIEALELLRADATRLPLPRSSADLFLSLWGLHCFQRPRLAIAEAARVLVPGGRLVGASFVRGQETLRQRLLIRPGHGAFGQVPTAEEIDDWLAAEGLLVVDRTRSGPFVFFDARAV
jgi:ubiquinone/menaquinone biosynthesis C-methylase UbiE